MVEPYWRWPKLAREFLISALANWLAKLLGWVTLSLAPFLLSRKLAEANDAKRSMSAVLIFCVFKIENKLTDSELFLN